MGYKSKYNQKIVDFIPYLFDVFTKDGENVVTIIQEGSDFPSSIKLAKTIKILSPGNKVALFFPSAIRMPMDFHREVLGLDVDLFSIEGVHVIPIVSSNERKIIKRSEIDSIRKTLNNINVICRVKWGISIFKIKNELISDLHTEVKNRDSFVIQIANISSILDTINIREIKTIVNPKLRMEKEIFEKNQSISILELFLNKRKINGKALTKPFRELRELRNIPPIHPSVKFKKICRKFIGKNPNSDLDWAELSQVVFVKFKEALVLLKDTLRDTQK